MNEDGYSKSNSKCPSGFSPVSPIALDWMEWLESSGCSEWMPCPMSMTIQSVSEFPFPFSPSWLTLGRTTQKSAIWKKPYKSRIMLDTLLYYIITTPSRYRLTEIASSATYQEQGDIQNNMSGKCCQIFSSQHVREMLPKF